MEQAPESTTRNGSKTSPIALEYGPAGKQPFRLTGWDWSLIASVPGFVIIPTMSACACNIGAVKGRAATWLCLALMARLLVGVLMRDRSRWYILYISLYIAVPVIVDTIARYAGVIH